MKAAELERTCIIAEYQPRERLGELLGAADLHLASMLPGWSGVMVPSKLFGILAAARPVVFIGPEDSEVARVIEELECGSVVAPGDVQAMRRSILDAVDDREAIREAGRRGYAGMVDEHDATHRLVAWRTLLERVAGSGAAS